MSNENQIELLWGAKEISEEISTPLRRTFWLLGNGHLPARKIGGRWCAERGRLKKFFTEDGNEQNGANKAEPHYQ